MMRLRLIFVIGLLLLQISERLSAASTYTITRTYEGSTLKYTLTDDAPNICTVTGYSQISESGKIIIPEYIDEIYRVTEIGKRAFKGCQELKSIEIPNSVNYISEEAFYECFYLTSVSLPTSIVQIYPKTFSSCKSLNSITIPNSVLSIHDNAFSFSGLTSIDIPNSVTYIGNEAFFRCDELTSVIVPETVETIEQNAFHECSNMVKSAYPQNLKNPFNK